MRLTALQRCFANAASYSLYMWRRPCARLLPPHGRSLRHWQLLWGMRYHTAEVLLSAGTRISDHDVDMWQCCPEQLPCEI